MMLRPVALLLLVLAAILAVLAAKSQLIQLPDPKPASVQGEFSAERAARRLAQLLGDERPHPADTAANDAVRGRLVAQLSAMGLRPQVRDQIACNEQYKGRGVTCARIRNVVATIGPAQGRHLLLSAHYDSTPVGPGAGDAGSGVASLLEVAFLLKDRPLRRPVTFLFNEGEELGLIGARAFVAQDSLAERVDSLINLEARGVFGPASMFETSRPNAPAIAAFSGAVDRPVANSLSTDVYRQMPNYTDVNTFEELGWTTLNIAIIGNETRYHSAGDNLAALDRRSLQHMGDQALALALRLSNGIPEAGGERLFMDIAGRELIVVPMAVGLTLLELLLLAFAWISWRRRSLARGLATMAAALVAGTVLAWGGEALMGLLRAGDYWRGYPIWMHLAIYSTAMAAAVATLVTIGKRLEARQLRPAFWLTFLLLGTLVALRAPGGAIYFLFPPLITFLGVIVKRWWRPAERLASAAAILFLYVTWGSMLGLLEELLNQGPMWLFAPLGLLLILPMLIEAKALLEALPRTIAIASGAAAAALGWTAVAAAPAYSADRQQQFTVEHITDTTAGRAYWSILSDFAPLPAAYRPLGDWRVGELPHSKRKRWLAPAPAAGARPPAIEVLERRSVPQGRMVRIRLRPNGSESVALVAPEDSQIRAAGTRPYIRPISDDAPAGPYVLRCFGRSCDGLTMDIVTSKPAPIDAVVVGSRRELPPSARPLLEARPGNARPQYQADGTVLLTRTRL